MGVKFERSPVDNNRHIRLAVHAIALFQDDRQGDSERILYLDPMTWRRILAEFRLHGVNLNQCAWACNKIAKSIKYHSSEIPGDDQRIQEILSTLKGIESLIREMIAELHPLEDRSLTALDCKHLIKAKKEYEREWAESRRRNRKSQSRR